MNDLDKRSTYQHALQALDALLQGVTDPVTTMATCAAVLHEALPYSSWTGFYRLVTPRLLRIGPYQGPVGCLEIALGHGVCGVAAEKRETQLVPDVHAFPGHIACDANSRSEIVVPVLDRNGQLTAVLDLDSHAMAAFDHVDQEALEELAHRLTGHLGE